MVRINEESLMGVCTDSRLTFLNGLGYNVIRLPREGIDPLHALGRDPNAGTLENLGSISKIWKSDTAPPVPDPPGDAADVNGQRTDDLKLSIGLEILSGVLSGFGVSTPSVNVAYERARSVQFEFTNVKVVRVEPLALGEYLANGDLNQTNPFASYFTDSKKAAFVVTEVLKASSVKVIAKDKSGTTIGVDAPVVQNLVGVKVNVGAGAAGDHALTYQGQKLVTFGFKAFGVAFMDGDWRVFGVKPSKEMSFAAGTGLGMAGGGELAAPADDTGILLHTGGLLDLA